MPVYNTEEYVEDALLSVMNQTLKEIEIIVINDGSTDNSFERISKLAQTDPRIRIFSQTNKGLSEARNVGMSKTTGEFIYFMDSDDLLEEETLLCCYEKCCNEQLDFVFFDAEAFRDDHKELDSHFSYNRAQYVEDRIYTGPEILEILLDKMKYRASVCLNLINRNFLFSNNHAFYPDIIHEDELFSGILYLNANRVGCISKRFFKRRVRVNSIMTNNYSFHHISSYLTVVHELIKYSKTRPSTPFPAAIDKLISYILNPSVYNANVLSFKERNKVFMICVENSYFKYLTLKNLIILLFPFSITLKSYFKKK